MNRTVIALGFFDGVHRGHGALLEKTAARARELEAVPAAFTFDRPPKEVVTGRPVGLINTPDDRRDLMQRLYGIRQVIIAPFDRAMMTMPWQDFIDDLLIGTYGAVHLVAGHDYHFGHRNQGDPDKLLSRCRERGIGCDIIPQVTLDGITVSSTYIRTLIESGQMERAADFLGHRHCLTRTVTHGCRFGRTIGIPTVNLTPPDHVLLPARGVYVTRVFLPDGAQRPRCHQHRHPSHRQRRRRRVGGDLPAGFRRRPLRQNHPGGVLPPPAPGAQIRLPPGAEGRNSAQYPTNPGLFYGKPRITPAACLRRRRFSRLQFVYRKGQRKSKFPIDILKPGGIL